MSNKVNNIDIKSPTYCFFDDLINIENFDLNNIEIDEKSCKNILIYYILIYYHLLYVMIKDSKYIKNYSVYPLYLIFRNVT